MSKEIARYSEIDQRHNRKTGCDGFGGQQPGIPEGTASGSSRLSGTHRCHLKRTARAGQFSFFSTVKREDPGIIKRYGKQHRLYSPQR